MSNAGRLSRQIEADLKAPVYVSLPATFKPALTAYLGRLGPWQALANALTEPDGTPVNVAITMLNGNTQRQLSTGPSALDVFGAVELRDGDITHGNRAAGSDVLGKTSTNSAVDLRLGRIPVEAAFHFHFFRVGDNSLLDMDCPRNYTALRFITSTINGGARPDAGGYLVPIRPDTQRPLWVRLSFPRPLPPVNEWPTRASLEVD